MPEETELEPSAESKATAEFDTTRAQMFQPLSRQHTTTLPESPCDEKKSSMCDRLSTARTEALNTLRGLGSLRGTLRNLPSGGTVRNSMPMLPETPVLTNA